MPEIDPVILQLRADVGKYTADVRATTTAVQRSLGEQATAVTSLERQMETSGRNIGSSIRLLIGGALAAVSAQQIYQLAKSALEYASSLGEVSQQLGVTAKQLQVLQFAGSQVGLTNEETRDGLSKLTRTLGEAATGSEKSQKALQLVGFSLNELKAGSVTAGDAIPRIADALAKIPSATQRAAIEVELFGRAGQRLDTLLSGGSGAINELSEAAEKLGIVLSDAQIQRADETADKLSAVKQVLEASIAGIVSDNAQSILGFASALETLVRKIPSVISGMEELRAYLNIGGGILNAAGGIITGNQARVTQGLRDTAGARGDLAISKNAGKPFFGDKLNASLSKYLAGMQKQIDPKLQAKLNALNAPSGPKASAGPKGKTAAQLANEAARRADQEAREQAKFENELTRSHAELLDAQADLTGGIEARYKADLGRISDDRDEYARGVALLKGITETQRQELIAAHDKVLAVRESIAEQQRAIGLANDTYELAKSANDAQQEELQARSQLTDSIAARRDLELQLLAKRKEAERLSLQNTIDTSPVGSVAADNAGRSLGSLDRRYANQAAVVNRQNQSPGQAFVTDVNKSAQALNEDYERVAANGLQSLNDGLADALSGAKSLGDVFHNVAGQIIGDLLRIAIQQTLIKPLANALFGGSDSSSGSGLFGSIVKSAGSLFGRASGGFVAGGDLVRVNEGASAGRVEGFRPVGSGTVIPLGQMANRSTGNTTIVHAPQFNLKGAVITPQLYADMQRISEQSAAAAGQAAYKQSMKDAPAAVGRARRYGTS